MCVRADNIYVSEVRGRDSVRKRVLRVGVICVFCAKRHTVPQYQLLVCADNIHVCQKCQEEPEAKRV